MKNRDLVNKLLDLNPEAEVYFGHEYPMPIEDVIVGHYIDDGLCAPDIIPHLELKDCGYDIDEFDSKDQVIGLS